jgi:hypothetical protein
MTISTPSWRDLTDLLTPSQVDNQSFAERAPWPGYSDERRDAYLYGCARLIAQQNAEGAS